eukprot:scaffold437_cov111-Cylindrotheca_fusiformis.AAC.3
MQTDSVIQCGGWSLISMLMCSIASDTVYVRYYSIVIRTHGVGRMYYGRSGTASFVISTVIGSP